jgi:DNA helicase-4
MTAADANSLIDELIQSWSQWETNREFYIDTLAPAIARGDWSIANLTDKEKSLVGELKGLLSDAEWHDFPSLLDRREAFLREDKLRREAEARLRPILEREEKERFKAAQDLLERQTAEELKRREEQRKSKEAEIRRRRQALFDRISRVLKSDFLMADVAYTRDADRELLSQSEYEGMKSEFVKAWAQQELDLKLDDEQAAAVATVGSDVRVTARAGSGKTRTLVTRAIFLIRHCKVSPRSVLLLAFNKRAAEDIHERLEAVLGNERPHVMTFHALAHALVHPEEALVHDDPGGDSLKLSHVIQNVIDEHITSKEYAGTIQGIMLEHFREDWEKIVTGGFQLGMDEFLKRRRALPRETLGGEFVKSYGEKLVANTLFEHGLRYVYEKNHRWDGINYRPDFTLMHPKAGGIVIEYFGLQGDADYDEQAQAKRVYWSTRQEWRLLEYTPRDLADGGETFAGKLLADLAAFGLQIQRLPEEEIWELVRRRAIDRFTGAVRTFVTRSRKLGLSDAQLAHLIEAHAPITAAEKKFLEIGRSSYRRYIEKLKQTDQEDFDGLVWRAIELLKRGFTRFARDRGRERGDVSKLRFLLIDEFQDFSQMFFEIVTGIRLAAAHAEVFCVGDDWQAINSFAGSDLRYFHSFDDYFHNGTSREIRTNYRSPKMVVAAGNAVMIGRGAPAIASRGDQGVVWLCDLEKFDPTAIEVDRHRGDDITPAVLRLVQHYISLEQNVVLLSRRNGIPWNVTHARENHSIPNALESFLDHIRSYLPEEDRKRVNISTTHKYKGLEQAAIIVLDAVEGSYPLIHPSWVFLRLFGDTLDKLEDEERRLFYVAVTRAAKSLCLVTEGNRRSPYLRDIQKMFALDDVPWPRLPPAPSLSGPRVEVWVFEAREVKDELIRVGFRFKPKEKYWSRSFPAETYSEEKLLAKTWYRGTVQVEVRTDQGKVIRKRSRNLKLG